MAVYLVFRTRPAGPSWTRNLLVSDQGDAQRPPGQDVSCPGSAREVWGPDNPGRGDCHFPTMYASKVLVF